MTSCSSNRIYDIKDKYGFTQLSTESDLIWRHFTVVAVERTLESRLVRGYFQKWVCSHGIPLKRRLNKLSLFKEERSVVPGRIIPKTGQLNLTPTRQLNSGYSIHRRYFWTGVRPLHQRGSWILHNLMVRLHSWSFRECGVPLHCHCSQVHSDSERWQLIWSYLLVQENCLTFNSCANKWITQIELLEIDYWLFICV